MRVNELALSQAVLPSLAKVGIHEVEQLAGHRTGELLRHPELSSGAELYELICELHRHGLTPFSAHGGTSRPPASARCSVCAPSRD